MKQQMKKVGALLLALVMCLSMSMPAMAATTKSSEDEEFSITISNAYIGSTYSAYKIFDVTYDENENYSYTIDSDSAWYNTVAAATDVFTLTQVGETTTYVVTVVNGVSDSAVTSVFTNVEKEVLNDADVAASKECTETPLVLDVTNFGPGYYFVTTTTGTVVSITTTDPNANIIDKNTSWELKKEIQDGLSIDDETMHEDAEAMGDDVEFKITANVPLYAAYDPEDPDLNPLLPSSPEGYLVTDYEFSDKMSTGLEIRGLQLGIDYTIDNDGKYWGTATLIDTWVTIDNEPISTYAYNVMMELIPDTKNGELVYDENGQIQFCGFTLTYDTLPYTIEPDGTKTLYYNGYIVTSDTFADAAELVDALEVKYPANASIEIDYTAHVTDEAVYDNTNEITMEWHATTYKQPNPNEPVYNGTELDQNDIYVLDIEILKIDGIDENLTLAGAEFQLSGTNLNEVVTSEKYTYTAIESMEDYNAALAAGTNLYFKLKNTSTSTDAYTSTNPYTLDSDTDAETLTKYEVNPYWGIDSSGSQTGEGDVYEVGDYKYVAYTLMITKEQSLQSAEDSHVTGVTGSDGMLSFNGLTVGDWTLTEITAPDGYNLLTDPIEFTISVTWGTDGTPTWTITNDNFTPSMNDDNEFTGSWSITIENNSGTELPSTGGMGTTIFYILGAILVCGAGVLLITRRRMSREA